MIDFLKKHKIYIYILLFLLVLLGIFFVMKNFLYPDDLKSIYGSRLNGIEEVKIDNNRLSEIKVIYANEELISSIELGLKGKIINIIIKGKEGYTIDVAKKAISDNLTSFSEKERNFYDIQFFVSNEFLNYNLIGYKNKSSEIIAWSEYSEVIDETEKEQ